MINSKSLIMLMVAMALVCTALSQPAIRFSGTVIDSLTNIKLAGVTISLKSKEGKVLNEISGQDGSFAFYSIPDGEYTVEANHISYHPFRGGAISLTADSTGLTLTIRLAPKEKILSAVTVAAEKQFITQTVDKITIDVSASPIAAASNAYDVLLRAPGVIELQDNLQFRGKGINVLINGRPFNLSGADLKNYLMNLPANAIEKIEILPDPSAKYDAQGGSIINIRLAKNKNFGTNGTLTTGIGTGKFIRYNGALNLNYRNKKLNIYGGYDYNHNRQYYENSNHRIASQDMTIEEDEYEVRKRYNQGARLGLDYDFNKRNSAGFLFNASNNLRDRNLSNKSALNYVQYPADTFTLVNTTGYARFSTLSANAFYKTILDTTGKELTINADYFIYAKKWDDHFVSLFFDENGAEYANPYLLQNESPANNQVKSITADYTRPGKKINLEAGLKIAFTKTDNDVVWEFKEGSIWKPDAGKTNRFIYRENIFAGYLNAKWHTGKFGWQAGLRLEHTASTGESVTLNAINKRNYTNLFPNIAIQYTQSPDVQFGFNYRKSIQRFGFDIVNPFVIYQSQYSFYQGNPNIQPIIMHSIGISHSWKYQLFTNFNFTFMKDAIGMVFRKDPASIAVINSFDNLDNAFTYNFSVSWNKTLWNQNWNTSNSAGAFYITYQSNSKIDVNNRQVSGYFNTNNTFRFKKGFNAEISGYYRSRFASGILIMKDYYGVSVGLSKDVLKKNGSVKLSVTDIFNTQTIKYDATTQDIKTTRENKIESRFVNLVFSWKFGNSKVRAAKTRRTGIEEEKGRMQ